MDSELADRIVLHFLTPPRDALADMEADVRSGFAATPKTLPPKYFYDARGSALFEEITRLPEYYLTRAETALLEAHATDIVASVRPSELLEIGSGAARKTQLLLSALGAIGGKRYVALDVSEDAVRGAAERLVERFDWIEVLGLIGDFHTDLPRIRRSGRRLVAFLGSTIGNLEQDERARFLADVGRVLGPDDAFLVGVDLVKSPAVLEAAYNDSRGVTAEFNQNALHVLNRELRGDLSVEAFEHVAVYDREKRRIVSSLRAARPVRARFERLDLTVHFEAGESLYTEISAKFERATFTAELEAAGLACARWIEGSDGAFALALARPA